jgi:prepilin-type N-terminal cleavage/methylation domain-containing protein
MKKLNSEHYMNRRGMTLIEVMLAVAIVIIAALGAMCYEYLSVNHVRFARAQLAATRVGQILIEDWKSTGAADNYNPEYLQMGFDTTSPLPNGSCETTIDGLPLYISFSSDDVARDDVAGITLRQINVIVHWNQNFGQGAATADDPGVSLTTYVRRDR